MRRRKTGVIMRSLLAVALSIVTLAVAQHVRAEFDDLPPAKRAGYTALAVVENVVPIASTVATPRCLQGYVLCKFTFAFGSVLMAGEQLLMSGGSDLKQTRALLHRGFGGDWVVTPRHAAGDLQPQVLPDPPPVAPAASGSLPPSDMPPADAPQP
jgi:hypothetical protein